METASNTGAHLPSEVAVDISAFSLYFAQVAAYASVGFPLGRLCRWLLGSSEAWAALAQAQLPKLLIMGMVRA